jgi:hypothetical protein
MNQIKEKLIGTAGTASGTASILGSWQVCHSLCLGLIAFLSVFGITVTGMPLLFFTKIAIPLWSIALVLLLVVVFLYLRKKCISLNLILFNTGVIIAGMPFASVQPYQPFFWIIGGSIALAAVALFIKEKMTRKKPESCAHE